MTPAPTSALKARSCLTRSCSCWHHEIPVQGKLDHAPIALRNGKSWSSSDRRRSYPLVKEMRQILQLLSGGNVPEELNVLQKSYDETGRYARSLGCRVQRLHYQSGNSIASLKTMCLHAQDTTNESGQCFKWTYLASTPGYRHHDLRTRGSGCRSRVPVETIIN